MRKLVLVAAALSSLALLASTSGASAKPRYRHHHSHRGDYYAETGRRSLVIERRSFLDPGTKVPVGYYNHYATTPAYVWGGDPTETFQRDRYMDGILHQAFDPQPTYPLFGGF
jgi:hypothetical protein